MPGKTDGEKAADRRARLEAHVAKLKAGIVAEVESRLDAAGIPPGTLVTDNYFDGALLQRIQIIVHWPEERRKYPGWVASRAEVLRALEIVKEFLPNWVEENCHTKMSDPPATYNKRSDSEDIEGWVFRFYQHV